MDNNSYALAHEQAENERAELRAQIERLMARDAKLEKLVMALKEVLPTEETHTNGEAPEHHYDAPEHQG